MHGVVVQGVPFAGPGSRFTRDFEDLVAWLVTRTDKSSVSAFARVAWRTVGAICERVVDEQLDDSRFEGLVSLGVDEISWKKHHNYLTLVSDHETSPSCGEQQERTPRPWISSSRKSVTKTPKASKRSAWTWEPHSSKP